MWLAAARRAIIARLGATLGPNEPEKINHEDKQWPVDMTTPPPCDVSRVTWLVTLRPPPPSHHDQCQGILACGEWTYSGLWRDLQTLSSSIHTLLHPLLIYSGNSAISRNTIFSHLRVLWTTSAALSLLSWFRLLSLAHSSVMDRPAEAEVRVVEITIMLTLVCIYCVPDMSSTTVTTPTTEVNIMEEKQ